MFIEKSKHAPDRRKKENPEHSADVTMRPRTRVLARTVVLSSLKGVIFPYLCSVENFSQFQPLLYCNTRTQNTQKITRGMHGQWGRRQEGWPNTEARLAGWRRVTQPMVPFLTDRTACPGLQLLSFELLAKSAAVAYVLVYRMYTKHCHELYHARKAWNQPKL